MPEARRRKGGAHSKKQVQSYSPQKRTLEKKQAKSKTASANIRLGSDVLYMAVLLAITMLISAGLLQNQLVTLMPQAGQSGVRASLLFVSYFVVLLALSYAAYRHRENALDFYRLRARLSQQEEDASARASAKQTLMSAGLVLSFLVGLRIFSAGWTLFTQEIGWRIGSTADVLALFGSGSVGLILTVVLVVVLAPLVEELVFRGLIQKWLAMRMAPWLSIGLTSLLFALYHLSFWAAPLNIALGICTGYLAKRCQTLYPAIALHLLYNATIVGAAFYLASM